MSNTRFEYFSFGQFEYSDIIVTHKQAVHLKERATQVSVTGLFHVHLISLCFLVFVCLFVCLLILFHVMVLVLQRTTDTEKSTLLLILLSLLLLSSLLLLLLCFLHFTSSRKTSYCCSFYAEKTPCSYATSSYLSSLRSFDDYYFIFCYYSAASVCFRTTGRKAFVY